MVQKPILVVGSINMDQVVQVQRLPTLGETLLSPGSLKLVPGGKGANQAVAIARLGAAVTLAGRIGSDAFGEQLLHALRSNSVDTGLISIDPEASSGVAFIFLAAGDNAIVVASGANGRVGQDQMQYAQILQALKQASLLVLQLEIPVDTVCTLISEAHTLGIPVVLNLAPAQPLPRATLAQVAVLVLNESEASLLSGQRVESIEDARVVATVLQGRGTETVVITLGVRGALLVTRDTDGKPRSIHQAAPSVKVADTTAAGDCFVGALAVALTEKQAPEDALRFAVYASAQKVTKFGAQPGLPTRAEVLALYNA